ncbi:hypothetical protein GJ496_008701 [Pomphorhynchus laevis]|nr:hypothetical protein GJ496_008701 [Pomphorhynchus laevis]
MHSDLICNASDEILQYRCKMKTEQSKCFEKLQHSVDQLLSLQLNRKLRIVPKQTSVTTQCSPVVVSTSTQTYNPCKLNVGVQKDNIDLNNYLELLAIQKQQLSAILNKLAKCQNGLTQKLQKLITISSRQAELAADKHTQTVESENNTLQITDNVMMFIRNSLENIRDISIVQTIEIVSRRCNRKCDSSGTSPILNKTLPQIDNSRADKIIQCRNVVPTIDSRIRDNLILNVAAFTTDWMILQIDMIKYDFDRILNAFKVESVKREDEFRGLILAAERMVRDTLNSCDNVSTKLNKEKQKFYSEQSLILRSDRSQQCELDRIADRLHLLLSSLTKLDM